MIIKRKNTIHFKKSLSLRSAKKLLWTLCFILITVHVILALPTASSGATLVELERKEAELVKKNRELKDELVQSSSLFQLGENAQNLGFIKSEVTVYIDSGEVVAKLP